MHRTRSKNLGKRFRFSKSLLEARDRLRERHIALSEFSPRQGVEEFLWRKKHVGRRSDRSKKQPKRRAGCRLRDFPREIEARRISTKQPFLTLSFILSVFWPNLASVASTLRKPRTTYPPSHVLR